MSSYRTQVYYFRRLSYKKYILKGYIRERLIQSTFKLNTHGLIVNQFKPTKTNRLTYLKRNVLDDLGVIR